MRRCVSIFLVLCFGLGPLTGMLEASDESRLPACCRRHGAHHCAMAMQMAAMVAGSKEMLTAPPTCTYLAAVQAFRVGDGVDAAELEHQRAAMEPGGFDLEFLAPGGTTVGEEENFLQSLIAFRSEEHTSELQSLR